MIDLAPDAAEMALVTGTTKEEKMDQFQLAIAIKAADDSKWGPRDVDERRRAFTAEELDALADFGWRWPDLKGAMTACAYAVRSVRWPRASNSVASPRLPAPSSILRWMERRGTQMSTSHRSRTAISVFAAVLVFALCAPFTVNARDEALAEEQVLAAEDQDPALAPAAAVTVTAQVPSDVRWAPARAITPGSPLAASQATSPDYLPAALASGRRSESAHLATVPLPGEDVMHGALADC